MVEDEYRLSKGRSIIGIHQPNYLPWLGYYYKIYQSDIFVFLDDAQFSNEGMHNYTYIKTPNGLYRLKYPVQQRLGDRINEVKPKDELGWKEKHLDNIKSNYCKSVYFEEVYNDYRELITENYLNIALLNIALIKFFSTKLDIKVNYVLASDLNIKSCKEDRIIEICKTLGGKVYYSGTGARAYQNEENFKKAGIELRYSIFKPVHYQQLWDGYQTNVSALDFFMNCGYDWKTVLNGQE